MPRDSKNLDSACYKMVNTIAMDPLHDFANDSFYQTAIIFYRFITIMQNTFGVLELCEHYCKYHSETGVFIPISYANLFRPKYM